MKKKIANAIELVLLLATYIVLNLKNIEIVLALTNEKVTKVPISISLMALNSGNLNRNIMLLFFAIIAIMCVVSILTKSEHKDGKIHSVLAVIWFFYLNFHMAFLESGVKINHRIIHSVDNFPFVLIEILAIAVVIVSFVKRSSIIAGHTYVNVANESTTQTISPTMSQADEISKFKELLDKGVITQEEFDEKKKQLLGL